jgi:hypothetical protein
MAHPKYLGDYLRDKQEADLFGFRKIPIMTPCPLPEAVAVITTTTLC